MSRRGDPLTDKILEEIRSTFALVFKNLRQTRVDVSLRAPVTIFNMVFPCQVFSLSLKFEAPRLHNPLFLKKNLRLQAVSFLEKGCEIRHHPCQWQPTLLQMPALSQASQAWHQVTFENIARPKLQEKKATPFPKNQQKMVIPPKPSLKVLQLQTVKDTLSAKRLDLKTFTPKAKLTPSRLYCLPIHKAPVPLHRFSAEMKERFKKALAEKAKTTPANIQIKIVYDRMEMTQFGAMVQDTRGNLICTPKSELVGKNHLRSVAPHRASQPQLVYLVFGTRLDTQESLRALVPAEGVV
jgi:hypothetical protein